MRGRDWAIFFHFFFKGLPKNLARHHSQVGRVDQRPIFDYFMTVKSALVLAGTGWRGLGGLIALGALGEARKGSRQNKRASCDCKIR